MAPLPHPVALAKLDQLMALGWTVKTNETYAPDALCPRSYGVSVLDPSKQKGVTVWTDSYAASVNEAARSLGAEW